MTVVKNSDTEKEVKPKTALKTRQLNKNMQKSDFILITVKTNCFLKSNAFCYLRFRSIIIRSAT